MPFECFFNFEVEEVDLEAVLFDAAIAEVESEATSEAAEACCTTGVPSLTTRNNAMRARVAPIGSEPRTP